jgi:hypothetical protein
VVLLLTGQGIGVGALRGQPRRACARVRPPADLASRVEIARADGEGLGTIAVTGRLHTEHGLTTGTPSRRWGRPLTSIPAGIAPLAANASGLPSSRGLIVYRSTFRITRSPSRSVADRTL